MPPPRKQFLAQPSKLANVSNARPISFDPTLGLVRDPQFWKRFSTAVHNEETKQDVELGNSEKSTGVVGDKNTKGTSIVRSAKDSAGSGTSRGGRSGSNGSENSDWLSRQNKKKRTARRLCFTICGIVMLVVLVAVLLGLHFTGVF